MPRLKEIIDFFEEQVPLSYQEGWDNCGLQVGREDAEITGILFALDLTLDVIREAISLGYNMIFTHHPLIFSPVSKIVDTDPVGKKVLALIENEIHHYCAHTNLDKAPGGINDKLAELLGLSEIKGLTEEEPSLGRIGILEPAMALSDFADFVREQLHAETLKWLGEDNKPVKIVALCSGAGSDTYSHAFIEGADVLVTAEIKHHIALEAKEVGMGLIDAGHFETETIILEDVAEKLVDEFQLPVCISKVHRGFFK